MEAYATRFVEAIVKCSEGNPICLAGHSFGAQLV